MCPHRYSSAGSPPPVYLDTILRLHIVRQRHVLRLERVPLVTRLEESRTAVHGEARSRQSGEQDPSRRAIVGMVWWISASLVVSDGGAPGPYDLNNLLILHDMFQGYGWIISIVLSQAPMLIQHVIW